MFRTLRTRLVVMYVFVAVTLVLVIGCRGTITAFFSLARGGGNQRNGVGGRARRAGRDARSAFREIHIERRRSRHRAPLA